MLYIELGKLGGIAMSLHTLEGLLQGFQSGQIRALARVISKLENEDPQRIELMKFLYPLTGHARVLGVTGSPGAGKSSLVDRMIHFLRQTGQQVAVVAVDPSSPFSGGALLGDRVRMQDHATDSGVFIRSMGTRGSLGGLARNTQDTINALDAFGFDWIIVETVGVGQAELDIMHVADITLVVLTPGAGDGIQTIKAGIMEIADIYVVNKADLYGAANIAAEIEMMLDMQSAREWHPPVVLVSTLKDVGLYELMQKIEDYWTYTEQGEVKKKRRQQRSREEVLTILHDEWDSLVQQWIMTDDSSKNKLLQVAYREVDPYTIAKEIMHHVFAEQYNRNKARAQKNN